MGIIAFSGQAGSGKDTAANYLAGKLPKWKRSAFALAVKKVYCDAFGVDLDFIENWKRIDEPPPGMLMPVRKSLQFIGDGFRQMRDDIWIDLALREDNLIISDGRYFNEAKTVKAKGGTNILVYRPGYLNDDPNPSESQIRPVVEWCLSTRQNGEIYWESGIPEAAKYYDYFFVNDGVVEDLYSKIDSLLIPALKDYGIISL